MEYLAIHTFTGGIKDIETPQAVRLAHPNTLANTLATVLEFEATKVVLHGHIRTREVNAKAATFGVKSLQYWQYYWQGNNRFEVEVTKS